MTCYIRYDKKNDELYTREFIAQFFEWKKDEVPYIWKDYASYENHPKPLEPCEAFYEVFCVDVARNERLVVGYFRSDPKVTYFTCDRDDDILYFIPKDEWINQAVVALGMEKILNKEARVSEYIEETMDSMDLN